MYRTSAEWKRLAREKLSGHYGLAVGMIAVYALIIYAISIPFGLVINVWGSLAHTLIYLAVIFLMGLIRDVFTVGMLRFHLQLARDKQAQLSDLFYGFLHKSDRFLCCALIMESMMAVVFLPASICFIGFIVSDLWIWTLLLLLFLVLGGAASVLLHLNFTLAPLLLLEQPAMRVPEAYRLSARLMKGRKGRLFSLWLNYLFWILLGILSCYVGLLWLVPYMHQTSVEFFLDLTGELDRPDPGPECGGNLE